MAAALPAWARTVDGLVLPVPVGGHPALDFCNTEAAWRTAHPHEYLHEHRHLVVWAAAYGLVPHAEVGRLGALATREPAAARGVLDRALAFRDALHEVLVGSHGSWDLVNAEVGVAAAHLRLAAVRAGGGAGAAGMAGWELVVPDGVDRLGLPLYAAAWSAAGLLTTVGAVGVRACPGRGCGWLFHDPRGRRRWCSMSWCGNRAKARRHAAARHS
ncbi:MAG TPA: CGNR zinc finger domain-containing protein [Rugosimonospora sp.]|nr:CGNR zinc finger domain-containing protein [Rugosimonospora sp.]